MNATETLNFKDQLLAHFKQQLSTLYGQAELRHDAAKIFEEQGFPTRVENKRGCGCCLK